MAERITYPDTLDGMIQHLTVRVGKSVPAFEIEEKAKLALEINRIKKERNAIILGHNYMETALFNSIPDYVGDSLGLSRIAAETTADVILFCGVRFMAETAKIVNPTRKVLLPAKKAGCSLASSITPQDVIDLKAKYPGVPVVTYINTYAAVKAECDVCCTSGNATKIVNNLDSDVVICIPDEFLAKNIARETGKKVITPGGILGADTMVVWDGKCEVHEQFKVSDIEQVRKQFPGTLVIAHPECSPEVVEASDFSGSTTKMEEFVKQTDSKHYLLLTECSMSDNIQSSNPEKDMLGLCSVRCPHMNEITLEDTLLCLQEDKYEIKLEENLRLRALKSIEKMFELG